jgi:hypothetical protein
MQNGFCESFNGRIRDELLKESLFLGLSHARDRSPDGSTTTTNGGLIRRWLTKRRLLTRPISPITEFTKLASSNHRRMKDQWQVRGNSIRTV